MFGKRKCRILKEIRRKIADENDIPYVTSECTHKGNCSGTCPRCESELRYLERQLEMRASLGKRVSVAALCAGLAMAAAGCAPTDAAPEPGAELSGDMTYVTPAPTPEPEAEIEWLEGEVAWPGPEDEEPLTGEEPPCPGDFDPRGMELSGYVAYYPEEDGRG